VAFSPSKLKIAPIPEEEKVGFDDDAEHYVGFDHIGPDTDWIVTGKQ